MLEMYRKHCDNDMLSLTNDRVGAEYYLIVKEAYIQGIRCLRQQSD